MATIKEVAEKAGVAVSTASYALNNHSNKVSRETQEKVIEAARKLNYRPNKIARGLVQKKTDTIGLFLLVGDVDLNRPRFSELIVGIMDVSRHNEYDIVLFSNRDTGEISYIEKCKERGVDGAVIFGADEDDPYLEDIEKSDIPIVLIDVPIVGKKTTYISSDDKKGAYQAVKYLLESGHENIAFMNGNSYSSVSQQRLAGYKAAYKDSSIDFKKDWILNGEFKRETAYREMIKFLEKDKDCTAVFVAANFMALGVLDALQELKIRVPEDMSVIVFDDINLASHAAPRLTSVSQKKLEVGHQAVEKLIKMIDGEINLEPTFLNYELSLQGSVKEID